MALSKRRRARWLQLINALRRELPTNKPVRVRTCRVPKDRHADICDMGGHWLIRIDAGLPWVSRVDALEHEYAHALDNVTRHNCDYDAEHGEAWGTYLSKCHRLIARV